MDSLSNYMQVFIGLISIVNPIGALPLYLNLVGDPPQAVRRLIDRRAAFSVFVILSTTMLAGSQILAFFGISLSSFRVAGGILLLLISISMMHAQLSRAKHTDEETQDAADRDSIAVVPVGMPLLAGPGSISTMIVYESANPSLMHKLILLVIILAVAIIVWLSLRSARVIARTLGRTGINVVMRIMGLIMTAVGVEFIAAGLRELFPGLS